MSAKLMWPIYEEAPPIQAPQDEPATKGQSRSEQEYQNSVMLLEAVACLKELSEIVLRHDRILTAQNWALPAPRSVRSGPVPIPSLQFQDREDNLSALEADKATV